MRGHGERHSVAGAGKTMLTKRIPSIYPFTIWRPIRLGEAFTTRKLDLQFESGGFWRISEVIRVPTKPKRKTIGPKGMATKKNPTASAFSG